MSYLTFSEVPNPDKKTKVWDVLASRDSVKLGRIGFWSAWRKYVFLPENSVFDVKCLLEITTFLEEHKEDRQ